MRTTVTLDPDVAAKLKTLARERSLSFKEALNMSVRLGLEDPGATPRRYRLPPRQLGLRRGIDLNKALRLAGELEDAELARKLELRK